MFGLRHKKYEPNAGGLEIFYSEANRISLRRTFSQVKQPILTRLSIVCSDSNGSPGMKAQENISLPPLRWRRRIKRPTDGTVTTPVKKKCGAIPETFRSRYCATVLSGGCRSSGEWRGGRKSPNKAMCPGTRAYGIKSCRVCIVSDAYREGDAVCWCSTLPVGVLRLIGVSACTVTD